MFRLIGLLLILFFGQVIGEKFDALATVPTVFKGRIRPLEVYARLWLEDIYGSQEILSKHQNLLPKEEKNALEVLWNFHFYGHALYDDFPLFKLSTKMRKQLSLNPKESHFSYNQLHEKIYNNAQTNLNFLRPLILASFQKAYERNGHRVKKLELTDLSAGLWVALKGDRVEVLSTPQDLLWSHLKSPLIIGEINDNGSSSLVEEGKKLLHALMQYQLNYSNQLLKIFPTKNQEGEWRSIHDISDSDAMYALYSKLKNAVVAGNVAESRIFSLKMAQELHNEYGRLSGKEYKRAVDKALYYPSAWQLHAEAFYYRYPLALASLILYLASIIFLLTPQLRRWGFSLFLGAFLFHTALLCLRCFILRRPPVSNMYETIIYVPWVASLASILFYKWSRHFIILLSGSLVSTVLLITLQLTGVNSSLENVQAVLDSQYWLIIHVLLVVGSYGMFALSGILGHIYLFMARFTEASSNLMKFLTQYILQGVYCGLLMLVAGTILGGVWAAQSWGRFWDWDPKESWAFISICIYLVVVHAYRFHQIQAFGLAVGAVAGLLAISFTWYGVNYILGTGLHSYGFGTGGEIYYYLYVMFELVFLAIVGMGKRSKCSL